VKIKEITSFYRNDFSAVMQCEHCESTQKLSSGYDDGFYHTKVIPAMTCNKCGKNRSGDVPEEKNDNGQRHVAA